MRILLSGASSFTGSWFAQALAEKGHEVCALFQGESQASYAGTRLTRVTRVSKLCQTEFGVSFGLPRFLEILKSESWDLYCHHASDVIDYRSDQFDAVTAVQRNTHNLRTAWEAISGKDGSILWTGTVFEDGEGSGGDKLPDINRYGLSKRLSWAIGLYEAQQFKLPIGKFVIPNPFGPFEEPRFTAFLLKSWAAGETPTVKTPAYVRDNIPVSLLSLAYVDFAERVASADGVLHYNPSGYVSTMGDFARMVATQVRLRTGWDCPLNLSRQTEFPEPLVRINTESVAPKFPQWSEPNAWDEYVEYYHQASRD